MEGFRRRITHRLSTAMPALFIILAVGIIVGSWMYSGTVPALIYYGLKFLNPSYLLVSAFIISAMTSIATGTAWGSASTAGIALISIANQLVYQIQKLLKELSTIYNLNFGYGSHLLSSFYV